MSLDGHQWNIPVESYFFTFSSTLSICSLTVMRSGSRLRAEERTIGQTFAVLTQRFPGRGRWRSPRLEKGVRWHE